ncbi:hypothetical protein DFQ14_1202 [Halopolyspora algeriensis]|uniref:Uncharacterized protein n=1 Tax=Halopolyspora algeriensis TaxID=1500506 RepID=A0A368VBW0_9ACTN|nr:hypothetical protein [Halopolyspora algeriensis]RCW38757.1 hypothetical protein DFQ14_1202 [Halopolyspora algeriensis]TQM55746.1 hypothetical protein FHU43_0522 [Halopolyspora algeriensis]
MRTETHSAETADADGDGRSAELPTTPCSVVWSGGHSYVLEGVGGRSLWAGVDDRGHPRFLTGTELQRRGWSLPPR